MDHPSSIMMIPLSSKTRSLFVCLFVLEEGEEMLIQRPQLQICLLTPTPPQLLITLYPNTDSFASSISFASLTSSPNYRL